MDALHIPEIETLLSAGSTFKHYETATYGEPFDLTPQEEMEYYHRTQDEDIHSRLMELFSTRRADQFRERASLEDFARSIHINTTYHTCGCGTYSPSFQYVLGVYNRMKEEGFILEKPVPIGACTIPFCRAANAAEIRLIEKKYARYI